MNDARDAAQPTYQALLRSGRRVDPSAFAVQKRIAVLSDATVKQIEPLLKALLAARRIGAHVHVVQYDAVEPEIVDADSSLYRFAPDTIVLLGSLNALRLAYHRETVDRDRFAERVAEHQANLWATIQARCPAASVVQANFVHPYDRQFGHLDHLLPETFLSQILRLDLILAREARRNGGVLIADVAGLANRVGLRHWNDERMWALSKAFCALEHLPLVAGAVADLTAAAEGRIVKCVVVDLDDTLWAGVVGDDGIEGIEMDPFGHAEPHHRLQQFLRELKRRGIVLAVCSKNDPAIARRAFATHPDMVLREEDVAVFVASWGPKPDGVRAIRDALDIGLDTMMFLDDNPFERALMREHLPDVIVPELPPDPADWVRFLCESGLFEATAFSDEDRRRADAYRGNAQRAELRASFSDIGEYLRSLDMRAAMRRFEAPALPRIAQLIQRTNQFSVAPHRPTAAECQAMMTDPRCLPFYVTLVDRFGDNGLVSVIVLRDDGEALHVDTWRMSCRVLGRGLESFVVNRIVELAAACGRRWVTGAYVPTAKNALVADLFPRMGFAPDGTREDGGSLWRLEVSTYRPQTVHLTDDS